MSNTFDFEKIVKGIDESKPAPLHLWEPELSGDIEITIDKQGVWRHCGEVFNRMQIPQLFSRILCREGDEYFLKTPVEKWRIGVEDVPFYFIHLHIEETEQGQQFTFISNTQEHVLLDEAHPLRIEINAHTQAPSPYIMVRNQMEGKLSRNLYYELIELCEIDEKQRALYLHSGSQKIFFGEY